MVAEDHDLTYASTKRRAVGAEGAHPSPSDFGRLVNLISNRGDNYAHHIITSIPPDFQTFLRPWNTQAQQ